MPLGALCGLTPRGLDGRWPLRETSGCRIPCPAEASLMLPTEDLFVYVYVLVDDAISSGGVAIAPRPGPAPGCTDAELLAVALVRHLLGRRSEAGFLAEVARDWAHLFPVLPHQSEANRRIRWLWGAFEQLRAMLTARLPADDCQQVDTTALPVKHTSRVRGPDGWTGPGNDLAARFGRDAAHAGWVLRLPAGRQDRPGQPRHPRLEHRARRGQRARGGRRRPPGPAAASGPAVRQGLHRRI